MHRGVPGDTTRQPPGPLAAPGRVTARHGGALRLIAGAWQPVCSPAMRRLPSNQQAALLAQEAGGHLRWAGPRYGGRVGRWWFERAKAMQRQGRAIQGGRWPRITRADMANSTARWRSARWLLGASVLLEDGLIWMSAAVKLARTLARER
jgi:hypothetical protein